jgi:hypothetical protein
MTHLEMDLILSPNKNNKFYDQKTYIHISGSVVRKEDHGLAVCFDKKYFISPLNS